MGFFGWILLGLFAGTIARALAPGEPGPRGCIGTTAVGILGALIGTFLARTFGVRTSGFSILELILQVVVAAIGVTIAVGAYQRQLNR